MLKIARASGSQVTWVRPVTQVGRSSLPLSDSLHCPWPPGGAPPHGTPVPPFTSLFEILQDYPLPKDHTTCFTRFTRIPFGSGPNRVSSLTCWTPEHHPVSMPASPTLHVVFQYSEQMWASAICHPKQGSPHPPFPVAAAPSMVSSEPV